MKHIRLLFLLLLPVVLSCKKTDEDILTELMYFPSNSGSTWETRSLSSLGWNQSAVQPLEEFLVQTNTKAFIILVNGKIVMESYFNGHTSTASWPWNSAGKTLVATTTGIAQQEGLLNINSKVSQYLGEGWTSAPIEKEDLITSKHLLTMTSGLNDANNLVIPSNLSYVADAGTRWSYHNVFQKLMDVISESANQDFETYFNTKLRDKIGMEGFWNNGLIFKIYHSNARSMARFGLLALNNGKWKNETIINETYFLESINTSQTLNRSYGYFWWLNGKSAFMLPGGQTVYPASLVPAAPADMYAAMGAAEQRIYVIPGKKMVIIRMGETADPSNPGFALSGFDNSLWEKINAVIQ